LTLGSIKKSLDVGTNYIARLLKTRMLKGADEKAEEIADCLMHDYANDGGCIEIDEARQIGLVAEMLPDDQVDALWKLRKLIKEKAKIEKQQKSKEMQELLKSLPPELLQQIPDLMKHNGMGDDNKAAPMNPIPAKEEAL